RSQGAPRGRGRPPRWACGNCTRLVRSLAIDADCTVFRIACGWPRVFEGPRKLAPASAIRGGNMRRQAFTQTGDGVEHTERKFAALEQGSGAPLFEAREQKAHQHGGEREEEQTDAERDRFEPGAEDLLALRNVAGAESEVKVGADP